MQYLPFPTLLSTTGIILLSLQILCKMSLARQLSTWRSLPDCSLVLSFISSAMFPGGTFFSYFICFLLPVGCIPGPPRSIAHPLSGTHPCLFDIKGPPVAVLISFTFPRGSLLQMHKTDAPESLAKLLTSKGEFSMCLPYFLKHFNYVRPLLFV